MGNANLSKSYQSKNVRPLHIDILGDPYIEKTYLVRTYETEVLEENTCLKIDDSHHIASLKVINIKTKLFIWNIADEDRDFYLYSLSSKFANGVILLYDVANERTFMKLPKWLETIRKANTEVIIFIIGARSDLLREREVSQKRGREFAISENLEYFECSDEAGENVNEVFDYLAFRILQNKGLIRAGFNQCKPLPRDPPPALDLIPPDEIEVEGKCFECKETRELSSSSFQKDKYLNGSTVNEEAFKENSNDSVAGKEAFQEFSNESKANTETTQESEQIAAIELTSDYLEKGKYQSELKTNSTPMMNFEDTNLSVDNRNAQSNEGCDSLNKEDGQESQSKNANINESCPSEDGKTSVKIEASLLSEEERLMVGHCPAWSS